MERREVWLDGRLVARFTCASAESADREIKRYLLTRNYIVAEVRTLDKVSIHTCKG